MKTLQHLSAIAIITIIVGLIYTAVQQTYRSNANDPQIQIAHDLRNHLNNGKLNESIFADTVDMEKSLAVFKQSYNADGKPIESTGYLNGQIPQLPQGVIDYVKEHGEDWITWQPQRGVRMAVGIVRVNASPVSYLAVGRSLKEVEERVSRLTMMVIAGWILCITIVLFNWMMQIYFTKKKIG